MKMEKENFMRKLASLSEGELGMLNECISEEYTRRRLFRSPFSERDIREKLNDSEGGSIDGEGDGVIASILKRLNELEARIGMIECRKPCWTEPKYHDFTVTCLL